MKVKIEFYFAKNCPRVNEMLNNIEESISAIDFEVEYIKNIIDENNEGSFGLGCPTLLVNGRDLVGKMKCDGSHLYCRTYPLGIPSVEEIKKFIINSY